MDREIRGVNAIYIPKRYGQSKIDKCPFCGKQAITQNSQKVPVCLDHSKRDLPPLKCMCGEAMEMLNGKWGVFFSCMKHGNMNLRKALEINPINQPADSASSAPSRASSSTPARKTDAEAPRKEKERKETVVTSDELDWMF